MMGTAEPVLFGMSAPHDRRWELTRGDFRAIITEHNHELTGYEPTLGRRHPGEFRYAGNAGYILGQWATDNGYQVRELAR